MAEVKDSTLVTARSFGLCSEESSFESRVQALNELRQCLERQLHLKAITVWECDCVLLAGALLVDERTVVRELARHCDVNCGIWGGAHSALAEWAAAARVVCETQPIAEGNTALHFAVIAAVVENMALLLSKGSDPLLRNGNNERPLDCGKEWLQSNADALIKAQLADDHLADAIPLAPHRKDHSQQLFPFFGGGKKKISAGEELSSNESESSGCGDFSSLPTIRGSAKLPLVDTATGHLQRGDCSAYFAEDESSGYLSSACLSSSDESNDYSDASSTSSSAERTQLARRRRKKVLRRQCRDTLLPATLKAVFDNTTWRPFPRRWHQPVAAEDSDEHCSATRVAASKRRSKKRHSASGNVAKGATVASLYGNFTMTLESSTMKRRTIKSASMGSTTVMAAKVAVARECAMRRLAEDCAAAGGRMSAGGNMSSDSGCALDDDWEWLSSELSEYSTSCFVESGDSEAVDIRLDLLNSSEEDDGGDEGEGDEETAESGGEKKKKKKTIKAKMQRCDVGCDHCDNCFGVGQFDSGSEKTNAIAVELNRRHLEYVARKRMHKVSYALANVRRQKNERIAKAQSSDKKKKEAATDSHATFGRALLATQLGMAATQKRAIVSLLEESMAQKRLQNSNGRLAVSESDTGDSDSDAQCGDCLASAEWCSQATHWWLTSAFGSSTVAGILKLALTVTFFGCLNCLEGSGMLKMAVKALVSVLYLAAMFGQRVNDWRQCIFIDTGTAERRQHWTVARDASRRKREERLSKAVKEADFKRCAVKKCRKMERDCGLRQRSIEWRAQLRKLCVNAAEAYFRRRLFASAEVLLSRVLVFLQDYDQRDCVWLSERKRCALKIQRRWKGLFREHYCHSVADIFSRRAHCLLQMDSGLMPFRAPPQRREFRAKAGHCQLALADLGVAVALRQSCPLYVAFVAAYGNPDVCLCDDGVEHAIDTSLVPRSPKSGGALLRVDLLVQMLWLHFMDLMSCAALLDLSDRFTECYEVTLKCSCLLSALKRHLGQSADTVVVDTTAMVDVRSAALLFGKVLPLPATGGCEDSAKKQKKKKKAKTKATDSTWMDSKKAKKRKGKGKALKSKSKKKKKKKPAAKCRHSTAADPITDSLSAEGGANGGEEQMGLLLDGSVKPKQLSPKQVFVKSVHTFVGTKAPDKVMRQVIRRRQKALSAEESAALSAADYMSTEQMDALLREAVRSRVDISAYDALAKGVSMPLPQFEAVLSRQLCTIRTLRLEAANRERAALLKWEKSKKKREVQSVHYHFVSPTPMAPKPAISSSLSSASQTPSRKKKEQSVKKKKEAKVQTPKKVESVKKKAPKNKKVGELMKIQSKDATSLEATRGFSTTVATVCDGGVVLLPPTVGRKKGNAMATLLAEESSEDSLPKQFSSHSCSSVMSNSSALSSAESRVRADSGTLRAAYASEDSGADERKRTTDSRRSAKPLKHSLTETSKEKNSRRKVLRKEEECKKKKQKTRKEKERGKGKKESTRCRMWQKSAKRSGRSLRSAPCSKMSSPQTSSDFASKRPKSRPKPLFGLALASGKAMRKKAAFSGGPPGFAKKSKSVAPPKSAAIASSHLLSQRAVGTSPMSARMSASGSGTQSPDTAAIGCEAPREFWKWNVECGFFPNCRNASQCPFKHPTDVGTVMRRKRTTLGSLPIACKYGRNCARTDCWFWHPGDSGTFVDPHSFEGSHFLKPPLIEGPPPGVVLPRAAVSRPRQLRPLQMSSASIRPLSGSLLPMARPMPVRSDAMDGGYAHSTEEQVIEHLLATPTAEDSFGTQHSADGGYFGGVPSHSPPPSEPSLEDAMTEDSQCKAGPWICRNCCILNEAKAELCELCSSQKCGETESPPISAKQQAADWRLPEDASPEWHSESSVASLCGDFVVGDRVLQRNGHSSQGTVLQIDRVSPHMLQIHCEADDAFLWVLPQEIVKVQSSESPAVHCTAQPPPAADPMPADDVEAHVAATAFKMVDFLVND